MLDKQDEVKLIRKARRGDAAAIEALIRAHQDPLYAFMLRLSGRPDVAQDMVQEAFVRVIRSIDRFDDRFRFSTWLFTIARRLLVNHMQKMRPASDTDTVGRRQGDTETPGAISAACEARHQLRDLLDRAMSALSPLQREIVLLFHQQHWGIGDIAETLSIPEGTVKSHLFRARR
ncbi:MAG: sigma-70 family RNA polymerase sigma factor, partial [Phycisphaerae bacterium]|nr:sigma-70 family RNA polymerase sigma factor [Phycisphaerae bacterium]